jgi:hypothetical protein
MVNGVVTYALRKTWSNVSLDHLKPIRGGDLQCGQCDRNR